MTKEYKYRILNDKRLSRRFLRNMYRHRHGPKWYSVDAVNSSMVSLGEVLTLSFHWGETKEGSQFWRLKRDELEFEEYCKFYANE